MQVINRIRGAFPRLEKMLPEDIKLEVIYDQSIFIRDAINGVRDAAFQGGILVPSYTASKSGVMGLTRELACEWAPHNINVNAIAPGYMATENTRALQEDPGRSEEIRKRIPAGHWGRPQDLCGAVVFLASAAADYVHGYTLAVDGGWLAR